MRAAVPPTARTRRVLVTPCTLDLPMVAREGRGIVQALGEANCVYAPDASAENLDAALRKVNAAENRTTL